MLRGQPFVLTGTIKPVADKPPGKQAVRGYLHLAKDPTGDSLALTHGAGTNSQSALLVALADALCTSGVTVLRCDLPFRQMRAHGPPRGTNQQDQEGLLQAVEFLRRQAKGRVFLGGHSYGGRMATMLAAEQPAAASGLVLLSYPLHPPLKPAQLRTNHFPKLHTPALFIHGSKDSFGSLAEMGAALALIPARTRLLPIAGAGHSLLLKREGGGAVKSMVDAITDFFGTAAP